LEYCEHCPIIENQVLIDKVHINDVANAFVLMVEEALKPNGGKATWGSDGYYFVDSTEFVRQRIKI
jgi:predicted oxidoreductase